MKYRCPNSGRVLAPGFCALALASGVSFAVDFHVDTALGDDAWSGAHPDPQPPGCDVATCTDGPWQTLSRVNQGGFVAGDSVLLRCGQTWRDSLIVVDSGAANNPVTFSSYGSACATSPPRISGSDLVQNWMPDAGQANVYVADFASPVEQLFVDGEYLRLAQHPDTGYSLIDADSGKTLLPGCADNGSNDDGSCFLRDADLSPLPDLTGAGIHIRTINWFIEDREVIGFDPVAGEVYWNIETLHDVRKDYGYYLDNQRWMLDAPGEWFQDLALGKLYVWLPDGSDPGQHIIEASVRNKVFEAQNVSHIEISDIHLLHAVDGGLLLSSVDNFVIDSLTVSDSGQYAITLANSLGTLQNSVIQRSVREGLRVKNSSGTTITGNQFIDTGTVGAPKKSVAAVDASQSDGLTITSNTISNAGNVGIRFMRDTLVRNNVIRNTCLVLDDCGAIYTWDGSTDPPVLSNSLVDSNIVVDVIGNSEGRPPNDTIAAGIYLDDGSSGADITNNIVVNADHGVLFNASSDHLVSNNTLFATRQNQLRMLEVYNAGDLSGNLFQGNVVFPRAYQDALFLKSDFDTAFATFSNNRYSLVHEGAIADESYQATGTGTVETLFDFPAWTSQRETDATAIAPFAIARSSLDPARPDNLIDNSTFTTDTSGWSRWPSNSDMNWMASCGWEGGCISYLASTDPVTSTLSSDPLSLVQGQAYLLEFAARGETADQSLKIAVRRAEPGNFELVGLSKTLKLDTQWSYHRLPFTATHTLSTARLDFSPLAGETIEFDDVRIIGVILNSASSDARILINETETTQIMPCPDEGGPQASRCNEYVDVDGVPVNWPISLDAWEAGIVIWAASPFLDSDFDTLADSDDNCADISNSPQKNADQDIAGDACDAFPADPAEWLDTDTDGTGNNADADDDNDGLLDTEESSLGTDPLLFDTDGDGAGDGLEDSLGTSPLDPASYPVLTDGDVNGDGKVDVGDLLIAQSILLGLRPVSPFELGRLDVAPLAGDVPSPDGQFTVGDYVVLQRKVSGDIAF